MNYRQKLIASLLTAICIITLAATMSGREAVGYAQLEIESKKPASESDASLADAKRQLRLADNIYLLASARDDLTGDDVIDTVLLVGAKTSSEESFAENIDIILRDGKSGQFTAAGLQNLASSQASLHLGDYNGNNTKDVLVTAPPQNGSLRHAIASFPNGQAIVLFSGSENSYSFISKQMKSQYADVSYPQVEDLSDAATREFINQTLETTASELVSQGTASATVSVKYDIVRSDSTMISVIFSGEQVSDTSHPILTAVTINLRNRKLITLNNIAPDRQSRRGIQALIETAAKQAAISDAPALGNWAGMYFTDQDLVLYYQPEKTEYKQLLLPLEKVKPFIAKSVR